MDSFRYPNESDTYRQARDALLEAEVALRAQTEAVAAQRRRLPLGGALKAPYVFARGDSQGVLRDVPLADLFAEHDTLLLYTMMFGPEWDAPCPSCTSIVDGLNVSALAVRENAAIEVVSAAGAEQLGRWADRRGWQQLRPLSAADNTYIVDYAGFEADDPAMVSIMNAFRRTPEGIFHCWGSELVSRPMDNGNPRHVDAVWPLWNLLDMTPGGRGEAVVPRQDYEHRWFSENVLAGLGD